MMRLSFQEILRDLELLEREVEVLPLSTFKGPGASWGSVGQRGVRPESLPRSYPLPFRWGMKGVVEQVQLPNCTLFIYLRLQI